ncbi:unnamed protein product [Tuber melanosporum]|uniref:(Perigord truffle) hypothetical protein n=1 Tax=Tuber melanosporum (strain Mel28) TaxID=656061 RepID=D5GEK7_TUBMM|nr:uncharacterized protein GSTUM_00006539001 [Tuber melanosporum]CAZ82950.1 unnamed protein product [Tuber melanosporum]
MPLALLTSHSLQAHIFKNLSLIFLSGFFLPISTVILLFSLLKECLWPSPDALLLPPEKRKTVMISSLATAKGLSLARSFYLAGHRVIGIDIARGGEISSGRFSQALDAYYVIDSPVSEEDGGQQGYEDALLNIIRRESVDLWICVSDVVSTVEDAVAGERIRKETECAVFQPLPETCRTLHHKNLFIQHTGKIGLNTPETVCVTSRAEALQFIQAKELSGRKYTLDSIALSNAPQPHSDMMLFPHPIAEESKAYISKLPISTNHPWLFQEHITGPEFCTHTVVSNGQLRAFVGCPSSEPRMHYQGLEIYSEHSLKLQELARRYVKSLENGCLTGQISFGVLVSGGEDGELKLFPIECNPRAHNAVVLFEDAPEELCGAYLSLLEPVLGEQSGVSGAKCFVPNNTEAEKYYWFGHDLVTLFLLPLLEGERVAEGLREFFTHLFSWKDATFRTWDPVPFWWLYHVYWPTFFWQCLISGTRWSRVDVSTTRVFEM